MKEFPKKKKKEKKKKKKKKRISMSGQLKDDNYHD
jgi:hypothetical protein